MTRFRLTASAQSDIVDVLSWSQENFGALARERYEALISAAIRDAASRSGDLGPVPRPELGEDVLTWHLTRSRERPTGGRVKRPRHFLLCRREGDVLVVGRVLHDSMDLARHVEDF